MPQDMHGVMHEFKHRELHSGSKNGPVVTNRKQAIAIGLSEQRAQGKHVPARRSTPKHAEPEPRRHGVRGRYVSDRAPVGMAPLSRLRTSPKNASTFAGRRAAARAAARSGVE